VAALRTIVSNTGCVSVVACVIARKISLVAVLLFECRSQVTVARLQLLEQPDILDRNDRLVGEGLEERDLSVRERSGLAPRDVDHPEYPSVPQHWNRHYAAEASRSCHSHRLRRSRLRVLGVDHATSCATPAAEAWIPLGTGSGGGHAGQPIPQILTGADIRPDGVSQPRAAAAWHEAFVQTLLESCSRRT
jgi:hypothetical protein